MRRQLGWGFPIMLCILASLSGISTAVLLGRCVLSVGIGLALTSLQGQSPESNISCAQNAVCLCPPNLAFKHPLKPTSLNTHCGSKTKTLLVVRWPLGIYSLKELLLLDLWLSTFLSLHKDCRNCWLSRQSSDFSVTAAGCELSGKKYFVPLGPCGPPPWTQ